LEALRYIHGLGLIHTDLKPMNIMFKSPDKKEIVLLDFGISKIEKKKN